MLSADKVLTVSPNYASEISSNPERGVELDGFIRQVRARQETSNIAAAAAAGTTAAVAGTTTANAQTPLASLAAAAAAAATATAS